MTENSPPPCSKSDCSKFICAMKIDFSDSQKNEVFLIVFGNFQDSIPMVYSKDPRFYA